MSKLPGIVFDATGVIYRGTTPLPGAREAFLKLIKHKVPYCILTNAGGSLEQERADRFNNYLGVPNCFSSENLIQAHTPMKKIMNSKTNDNLAIVTGQMDIHRIVDHYNPNFKYLTVPEICVLYPEIVPLVA